MISVDLTKYRYRGAGVLVALHEEYLVEFTEVWSEAKSRQLTLPDSEDPDYASLEHLLYHVVACARGYLVWCCEKLEIASPAIDPTPEVPELNARLAEYLPHLLSRWRVALNGVSEEEASVVYPSRWGVGYCVDAMLEHAVIHPMRHSYQLRNLLAALS